MNDNTDPWGVMMIEQGLAILKSQAEDRRKSIPYRPQYTAITGSVIGALLLQQINYWWHIQGEKSFYKFKAPCAHEKYKEGDSWCEELGFSRREFDRAIKSIGTKITKGTSKKEALRDSLVIYWTDSSRVTWYQVNEVLLAAYVYLAYHDPDTLGKDRFALYLDNGGSVRYLEKGQTDLYLSSETNTETTTDNLGASAPIADDEGEPANEEKTALLPIAEERQQEEKAENEGGKAKQQELPGTPSLEPETEGEKLLFQLLKPEYRAKGRGNGPKRWKSLECKNKFVDAASRLDGNLETVIRSALMHTTALVGITNYVAKAAENIERDAATAEGRVYTSDKGVRVIEL